MQPSVQSDPLYKYCDNSLVVEVHVEAICFPDFFFSLKQLAHHDNLDKKYGVIRNIYFWHSCHQ